LPREFGERPATFDREVAVRHRRTCPQRLHQPLVQTPGAEQRTLSQHLATLQLGWTARRHEDDTAIGVCSLAGRSRHNVDGPAGNE
jgi:hypothetical protein